MISANALYTIALEEEIARLKGALKATELALSNSRKAFETVCAERDGLLQLKAAQTRAIMRYSKEYENVCGERDAAIAGWQAVWHMLEAEPSYIAREAEAETANQVWMLQHPEETYAAAGSSVALARSNH